MVQLHHDSDSDLPRPKPRALTTRRASPQNTHTPSIRLETEQHDASKSKPFQASLRVQSSEPRPQRSLKKISNNVVSLPTPFGIPGRMRWANLHNFEEEQYEKSLRRSPSRKAKVAVSAQPIEIDDHSSSAQENSDAPFVDSEEEEMNTDIWMQPKPRQQRSPKRNETKEKSSSESEAEKRQSSSRLFAPTLLVPPFNVSRPSSSEDDKAAILT